MRGLGISMKKLHIDIGIDNDFQSYSFFKKFLQKKRGLGFSMQKLHVAFGKDNDFQSYFFFSKFFDSFLRDLLSFSVDSRRSGGNWNGV